MIMKKAAASDFPKLVERGGMVVGQSRIQGQGGKYCESKLWSVKLHENSQWIIIIIIIIFFCGDFAPVPQTLGWPMLGLRMEKCKLAVLLYWKLRHLKAYIQSGKENVIDHNITFSSILQTN